MVANYWKWSPRSEWEQARNGLRSFQALLGNHADWATPREGNLDQPVITSDYKHDVPARVVRARLPQSRAFLLPTAVRLNHFVYSY